MRDGYDSKNMIPQASNYDREIPYKHENQGRNRDQEDKVLFLYDSIVDSKRPSNSPRHVGCEIKHRRKNLHQSHPQNPHKNHLHH